MSPRTRKVSSKSTLTNATVAGKGHALAVVGKAPFTRPRPSQGENISPIWNCAVLSNDEIRRQASLVSGQESHVEYSQARAEIHKLSTQAETVQGSDLNDEPISAPNLVESMRCIGLFKRASFDSDGEMTTTIPSQKDPPLGKYYLPASTSTSTSTSTSAAEEGYGVDMEEPKLKKPRTVTKPRRSAPLRKGRSKWNTPEKLLTDPKSPLARTNLRDILCSAEAWDVLTPADRRQVLAEFPDHVEISRPNSPHARPNIAALRNNDNFRHDVARYQESLSKGYHDAEWIQQAQGAHRARQAGLYDDYMADDFEEKWEGPMPTVDMTGTGSPGEVGLPEPAGGLTNPTEGKPESTEYDVVCPTNILSEAKVGPALVQGTDS
ncbi:Asx homology domain-containing protein [Poronia punctata]|nr:Asx homology domain-containing protein [Poronia punctata]